MKKIILMAVLLIIPFSSGCFSHQDSLKAKFVVGQVVVVGNEPFTNLAVKINSTSTYVLKCDKETKELLWKNQGRIIKIFYDSVDNEKVPKEIDVRKVEFISKSIK